MQGCFLNIYCKKYIVLILLIQSLLFSNEIGLIKNYHFIDGLTSNNLTEIIIDSQNRTWIGTYNGISMYSGMEFENFYNQDSISEKYINCIIENEDNIWFGTNNALLTMTSTNGKISIDNFMDFSTGIKDLTTIGSKLFAVTKNKLLNINTKSKQVNEVNFEDIKQILPYNEKLFAVTTSNIYIYDINSGKKDLLIKPEGEINTIFLSRNNLLVGSNNGLYTYKISGSNLELIDLKFKNKNIEAINSARDEYWVSVGNSLYRIKNNIVNHTDIKIEKIRSIAFTDEDILLIASFGNGLYQLDPYGIINYQNIGNYKNIQVNKVLEMGNDLFFATQKGLFSMNNNKFLLSENIFDIAVENNKVLWIASKKGLYNYNGTLIKKISIEGVNSEAPILSLTIDKMNRKWLGTMRGIIKLDNRKGDNNIFIYDTADGLLSNIVFDACKVLRGIVATTANGINYYKNYNKWITYNISTDDFNACVYDDKKEALWVSTSQSGIKLINLENGEIIQSYTTANGLSNNEILGLTIDQNSHLWVFTDGGGTSIYNGEFWSSIDTRDGLVSNTIYDVYQKDKNKFIFSTQKGYSIYERRETNNKLIINQVIGAQKRGNNYTVPENSNTIIDISPIDYITDSRKYIIRYKTDDLWEYSTGYSEIEYYTSNSGINEFNIQFIDRDLNFSAIEKMELDVLKPWYLRPKIAIPLYSGSLILIITTLFSLIQYLKKRKESELLKEAELKRQSDEMEDARKFQMGMLPAQTPSILNLDIETYIETAESVGGDYYDFFIQNNSESLIVAIGDATGHGMVAGNIVSITKAGLNSVDLASPINETLETLNRIIKKVGIGRNRMCLNICHLYEDSLDICSAGMPPTYYYNNKANTIDELMISGLPAGSLKNIQYTSKKIDFNKGDILVMLTDGLPECENENGEFIDYERIKDSILNSSTKSASEIKTILKRLGTDWMQGNPITDDITFVVIKKC